MVSYRPTGVTILAAFIIITYGLVFVLGLGIFLFGVSEISQVGFEGEFISIVGMFLLIWAFLRLSMGFGLLKMRRRAWRSAMVVFTIGLIIDLGISAFVQPLVGQIFLDIMIIVYLLIVKKHFIY